MDVCVRGLRCAPVAQIRGGFINWEWEVCESGWVKGEITVRAGCANKRRIYKVGVGGLRKWMCVCGDYGARLFIFIKKRAYIFDEFF